LFVSAKGSFRKGFRKVIKLTDSALGNVASEMAGQSVLQTNSPQNKVTAALNSANKSKAVSTGYIVQMCDY
jgi:hypothetical protein